MNSMNQNKSDFHEDTGTNTIDFKDKCRVQSSASHSVINKTNPSNSQFSSESDAKNTSSSSSASSNTLLSSVYNTSVLESTKNKFLDNYLKVRILFH